VLPFAHPHSPSSISLDSISQPVSEGKPSPPSPPNTKPSRIFERFNLHAYADYGAWLVHGMPGVAYRPTPTTISQTLPAGFYITRLYDRPGRTPVLVVFLKRPAWDAIDGETQPATLAALPGILPAAAEIRRSGRPLIVVEYEEWKARVLERQHGEEKRE
jgi:hypothetical protein